MVTNHGHPMKSRVVGAGEFKTHCLGLLDEVAASRLPLTITKRGMPVARLEPIGGVRPLFGALRGTVAARDDLIEPAAPPPASFGPPPGSFAAPPGSFAAPPGPFAAPQMPVDGLPGAPQ